MLPGATPKQWPPNPGQHKVTLQREAADEKAKAMIAAAEAAVPSATELRKAAENEGMEVGKGQWWYHEVLGVRVPFAITGEAVAYLVKWVEGNATQHFSTYIEPASSVDYHASVAFHEEFTQSGKKFSKVHVVTLKLRFSQNFVTEPTSGMQFEKERVVVLDEHGKVLHLSGDGPTQVPVLAV
jgi:hypothetical protein